MMELSLHLPSIIIVAVFLILLFMVSALSYDAGWNDGYFIGFDEYLREKRKNANDKD